MLLLIIKWIQSIKKSSSNITIIKKTMGHSMSKILKEFWNQSMILKALKGGVCYSLLFLGH